MDKKFTICVPYEEDFTCDTNKEMAKLQIACNRTYVNDRLRLYGNISLNEVLRAFHFTKHKNYSYRWGWDYKKHGPVEVQIIKNPVNDYIWYLKFTAYDIVD